MIITTTTRKTIRRTHLTSRGIFTESMLQPFGIKLKRRMPEELATTTTVQM